MRKARLARGVPVKDWWRTERERILGGKIKGEVAAMYAECLDRSQPWAKSYRDFWGIPTAFTFPTAIEN
jgi:acetone carboxylase, alpha subunit